MVKDQFRYGRLGETTWKKRTVGGQSYVLQYAYDSMGRQRRLIYPDGEVLTYVYDAGGLVRKVIGRTGSDTYEYVKNILYNRHGSRTKVEYGNGVSTSYSYDPKMHRLTGVYTKMGARTLQQLQYSYDRVGNITERTDTGFTTTGEETKTVTHTYQYDDLHRLTDAEGTYKAQGSVLDDTLHTYENSFSYDTIGNIMRKVQQHEGPNDSGDLATMPGTTYTYNYGYNQARPHAVASINDGGITFRYDASGNMTARYNEEENSWRTLHWDEENRLVKTIDNDIATNYAYDAEGTRVTKSGLSGEVTYVDPAYVIRNNSIIGKHVFVGNTRVASKMDVTGVLADEEDENVEGVYYYHADHLGSSSVVTGKEGGFHERIEYFPYGETWVEDKASTDGYSTPYRYTAKEYDPETGLYYFGARYYDARLSRWVSADPALQDGKYFPKPYDFDTEHDYYWYLEQDTSKKLPGIGGVFNAVNLDVYHYGGSNPVKLVDPDGNDFMPIVFPRGADGWGHAAGVLIEKNKDETIGIATLYEQGNWGNTPKNNKEKIRRHRLGSKIYFDKNGNPTKASMKRLLKEIHKYRKRIGNDDVQAAYIKTTRSQDERIKKFSESRFRTPLKNRNDYNEYNNNCIDFVKDQARSGNMDTPISPFPKGAMESWQKSHKGYNYKK